ncbi:HNH endonuclease [Methylotenera sp.]|uniref:HNH endonuclease n=1 Tax=Methylotenera sp. TaxID=2051956 RepID=UPI002489DFE9|nr:HNH endonuclease [Methylotenera sp.]MDI1361961.1 HNH endonuclease [Methylotenera sp.]
MNIDGKEYQRLDSIDKITIADSFVAPSNKLGSANGEAKLYIGQDNQTVRNFFNGRGFNARCFLLKQDLLLFLDALKPEYLAPKLDYRLKSKLPEYYKERLKQLHDLPEIVWFEIDDQNQIEGPRIYINSASKYYKLIRTLSLPNVCHLSMMKLVAADKSVIYYLRLFTNYMDIFGSTLHPNEIESAIEEVESQDLTQAEKLQVIKARIGQGKYRSNLLRECQFCPVTLIDDEKLLIASHIKPWTKSSTKEKFDSKNGFMLSPTIDYMFDSGLITFADDKRILISPWISASNVEKLNLTPNLVIDLLPIAGRENYLKYHRDNIFKQ